MLHCKSGYNTDSYSYWKMSCEVLTTVAMQTNSENITLQMCTGVFYRCVSVYEVIWLEFEMRRQTEVTRAVWYSGLVEGWLAEALTHCPHSTQFLLNENFNNWSVGGDFQMPAERKGDFGVQCESCTVRLFSKSLVFLYFSIQPVFSP